MPLAVSATTMSGRSDRRVDERPHVVAEASSRSRRSTLPGDLAASRSRPPRPSSLICVRPVCSPTGAAPARQSLMPLYCAGLWLAVNIAPGASSLPAAK